MHTVNYIFLCQFWYYIFQILTYFYVYGHGCFTFIHINAWCLLRSEVGVRSLELELQMVVSFDVGAWSWTQCSCVWEIAFCHRDSEKYLSERSSWVFSLVCWVGWRGDTLFTANMQWALRFSPWFSPISVLILKCLSRFYCFSQRLAQNCFRFILCIPLTSCCWQHQCNRELG